MGVESVKVEETTIVPINSRETPETRDSAQSVAAILALHPPAPLYQDWGALKLYAVLIPGVLFVSSTVGYEGSMLNGLQALTTYKNYFHPNTAITGLINSSAWLGSCIAYPFSQLVGDRLGRKAVIYIGFGIMVVATVLQAGAQNLAMFTIARILFGFASTFSGNSASVLVAESAHPRDRKVISSLYNGLYYVGAIIAAWTTYGTSRLDSTWAWRIPSLLQGGVALFNIIFIPFIPESPRWLVANGKRDQALYNLAKAHSNGDIQDALIHAELREIDEDLLRLSNQSPWKTLFITSAYRKRLFLLLFLGFSMNWSGNGLVSYYLSDVLDTVGVTSQDRQTLINGILQIVSFLTCLVSSWAAGWVRRRTQFLASSITMFFSFISVTIANSVTTREPDNKSAAVAVIFFVFLFMCGYNWAFNPLSYTYPGELLPYNIRLTGIATVLFACTLAGFFNQWINPVGLENIGWRYYIVYVAYLAVEIVVIYFTFPETLGPSLEEVSRLIDNDSFITKLRSPAKFDNISQEDIADESHENNEVNPTNQDEILKV